MACSSAGSARRPSSGPGTSRAGGRALLDAILTENWLRPHAAHLIVTAMKKARILVVDDEPDLVELVEHHLRREHYEVTTALDGEAALAEARRRVPDLVVLDLMLPGMDG